MRPPILGQHRREIVAGQAHAAHHIDVEKPVPVVVGDFGEGLGFEYAEIVDQDVGVAGAAQEIVDSGPAAEIAGDPFDLGLRGETG